MCIRDRVCGVLDDALESKRFCGRVRVWCCVREWGSFTWADVWVSIVIEGWYSFQTYRYSCCFNCLFFPQKLLKWCSCCCRWFLLSSVSYTLTNYTLKKHSFQEITDLFLILASYPVFFWRAWCCCCWRGSAKFLESWSMLVITKKETVARTWYGSPLSVPLLFLGARKKASPT